MADSSEESREREGTADGADGADPQADDSGGTGGSSEDEAADELAALRAEVEEKYDFENFTPEQMQEMTIEEWEAAFDPDAWITGTELLDRVERDLATSIVNRDVFARIERFDDPERLIAYSDEGYAVVYTDGSLEGTGTIMRDLETVVALCSMDSYDVPPMPEGELLPRPMEVPEGSGDLGHRLIQFVAGIQILAAVALFGWAGYAALAGPTVSRFGNPASPVLAVVAGLGFLVIAGIFLLVVANARLSDRFRAEEYRNRLRAVGIDADEPPAFLERAMADHPELAETIAEEFPELDTETSGREDD